MKEVMKQLGKAICYFLLFLGLQVVLSMFASMLYGAWLGVELSANGKTMDVQTITEKTTAFLSDNVIFIGFIANILTILFLIIFFRIRKKKLLLEANWNAVSVKDIPYAIGLGVALVLFISFGFSLLPESLLESYNQFSDMLTGDLTVVSLIYTVIAAPIVEEIIFRGLILSRLRKAMSVPIAIIISSLLFALAHGQLLWMAYAFIVGCAFAIVDVKTNTIATSVLVHMLFNLLGMTSSIWAPKPSTVLYIILTVVGVLGTILILMRFIKRQDVISEDVISQTVS